MGYSHDTSDAQMLLSRGRLLELGHVPSISVFFIHMVDELLKVSEIPR